jgi:hypothetical protein
MYCAHPEIFTPPDPTTLWRYVDMERFLSLLSSKSLYMCRIDKFRDKWEGIWPHSLIHDIRTNWQPHRAQNFIDSSDLIKKAYFVSCWHASEFESAALWDLYSGKSGIAIRSTVSRLKQSIAEESEFYIGEVKYIDFRTEPAPNLNMLIPVFLKRKSFEYEREVRLLSPHFPKNGEYVDFEAPLDSKALTVDLNSLIDAIFVSPTAPQWLVPTIQDVLSRFGLPNISVEISQLYDPAVY